MPSASFFRHNNLQAKQNGHISEMELSNLDPHCLLKRLPKYNSRQQSRRLLSDMAVKPLILLETMCFLMLLKEITRFPNLEKNDPVRMGELRLSGNHIVTEYEMSGEPYSQKSGWIQHSNERIFQVMPFK